MAVKDKHNDAGNVVLIADDNADIQAVLDVQHGRIPRGVVNKTVTQQQGFLKKLEGYKNRFGG